MDATAVIWIIVAQAIGFLMQGMVGFGAGLIIVPILVCVGMDVPMAVGALLGGVMVGTGQRCLRRQEDFEWADVWALSSWRMVGIPVGVWLLGVLVEQWQPSQIKQMVGLLLAFGLLAMWTMKVQPREKVGRGWTVAAGISSGALGGLVGMSGPLAVMWVMAHDWSPVRSRATLWGIFFLFSPPATAVLAWRFGPDVLWAFLVGMLCFPAVALADFAGDRLGRRFTKSGLRRASYGLLVIIALVAMVEPLFG
ncbi:sulfite exporter TauE/SafE family protein [Mucisphaera calidilacus]|uniref:Probable membrane transporter protein n=1 Tax=Mucisphaera calidilacus TaxID=2527982 RepID=A0A518C0L7_9BACT|nr:sulfite exporter TauE/SafE family protein [Mucisphaera calidilacus]QDU72775.1 Sulfite exporter TauE/SafE [Mucisphaera calidilacus]